MHNSPLTASIHIIDDDSLLNVFYLYRPFLLGEEDDNEDDRVFGGEGRWDRGRWWYKLAHVCQRWRNVVLQSASYLGVSLVCSNGTPVADMLVHSPPLPLVIDYFTTVNVQESQDEEGAILALKQYDRVRRIRLTRMSATDLQKLIVVMNYEYPILEYLIVGQSVEGGTAGLMFPETLQAPHLRHLTLVGFNLPIGSRLLTTAVDLVTLCLLMIHPATYFHPNTLLQWLSFMPQLETLWISFGFSVPTNHDVERQLTHALIPIPAAFPNLHFFRFQGATPNLEALVHRISAPHIEKLELEFLCQLTYSVPRLLHFVNRTQNLKLRFQSAKFEFNNDKIVAEVYPHEDAKMYALCILVNCYHHFDGKVSSATQIFNTLGPMFSAVEHLTLKREVHSRSSEGNEADPTEWRKLLGSFSNVKTLRIDKGLVKELSCCLQPDDGEKPFELQELSSEGDNTTGDAFTTFVRT